LEHFGHFFKTFPATLAREQGDDEASAEFGLSSDTASTCDTGAATIAAPIVYSDKSRHDRVDYTYCRQPFLMFFDLTVNRVFEKIIYIDEP
jgi:hypothetical protein